MNTLANHTLIDYFDCDPAILSDPRRIRDILLSAIQLAGLTIVLDTFHHFEPQGVSGVVVISESHVTIHTWPEHAYAAVDVFTCGVAMQSDLLYSAIQEGLGAARSSKTSLDRGFHTAISGMRALIPR